MDLGQDEEWRWPRWLRPERPTPRSWRGMTRPRYYYLKSLRLVTAQTAHSLGIPAEGPTFVSDMTAAPQRCRSCPVTYTPLVYQTGEVTVAQHYHDHCGGIYCYATTIALHATEEEICEAILVGSVHGSDDSLLPPRPYGFLARLEPQGRISIDPARSGGCVRCAPCARAEAVRTREIAAFCVQWHPQYQELHEGILLEYPHSLRSFDWSDPRCLSDPRTRIPHAPGTLLPLCGTHELDPEEPAPLRFHVRAARVSVSTG